MRGDLKGRIRERLKEHTGTADPKKQAKHFDKDEKLEGELEDTAKKAFRLVRRLRRE